jgi:hypothetical protein
MIKRVAISLLLGLMAGVAITEIPIFLFNEPERAPKEIVIVVPKGTAEQVARGEQPPSIPQTMTFVVGDTLTVKNEDTVDHKLGPLRIAPGESASLLLDRAESLVYECSFQPGNYFGMDILGPLTLSAHLSSILGTGLPLGILLAVYSFALPAKKKEHAPE